MHVYSRSRRLLPARTPGGRLTYLARTATRPRVRAPFAATMSLTALVALALGLHAGVSQGLAVALPAAAVCAYGLLAAALRAHHVRWCRQAVDAARADERRRLARDLHDGMAQDLAVIAAYGQRLNTEFGPDHPLIVASRRALAASRGVLVDLSASTARDTVTALTEVAEELAARFGVAVEVHAHGLGAGANEPDLEAGPREEIVRIAREAVVNAARHGGARQIDIRVERHGRSLRLTVLDDGCGIAGGALLARHGFGLPTMRARAEAMGGRLTAARRVRGGTALAVTVPHVASDGGRLRS